MAASHCLVADLLVALLRVCRPLRAMFVLLVSLVAVSAAPARAQTWVSITPSSRVIVPGDTVHVTVLWCDYSGQIDIYSRSVTMNGSDITGQLDLQWNPTACGFTGNISDEQFYSSTGTITLDSTQARSFQVNADIYTYSYWLYSAVNTYKLPDPRRRIVVVADAQFQEVRPNTRQTQRFTLYNSGTGRDTFDISRTTTGFHTGCSGCSLSATSAILDGGQSTTVTSTDSVGAVGTTDNIVLHAARRSVATFADSSWTDVSITAGPTSGVAIVGTAPGVSDVAERGSCVAVSAGSGAAAECGDLRLVHALPSVRTLGAARTPTLIYGSQLARPKPLVMVDVTLPSTGPDGDSVPSTVQGYIYVDGISRGTASWPGTQWGSLGATRRIVVPADTTYFWDTTAVRTFKVKVRYTWPGSSVTEDTSTSRRMPVVSRSRSRFGAGWWLVGLEQLVVRGDTLQWVGGDGSSRVYLRNAGTIYHAPSVTRPDSIVSFTYQSNTYYVRYAAGSAKVWFSSAGRHDSTVNRLGYRTEFGWTDSLLTAIRVPTTGSPLTYTLAYTSASLDSIIAPAPSGSARNVKLSRTSLKVNCIRDPDLKQVCFAYADTSGYNQYRVTSRTDRRSKVTSFSWNAAAQRLAQIQRPLSSTTSLVFAETRGLDTARVVDSAYTTIDGPRTDVSDVTRIWINGYGAPTRTRNALGRETSITYDASWPGLAAITIGPNGLHTNRTYTSRGLPAADTVVNPLGNSQNAGAQYAWDSKWDEVTQVTSPTNLVRSFSYDTLYGLRRWEQIGNDQSRRVSYGYDANRLLDTITAPLGLQTYLYHTDLGNVRRSTSPRGFNSYWYADAIGRDTLTVSPLDSSVRDSSWVDVHGTRTRTFYSVVDRVDSTRTSGPAVTTPYRTHHADTVRTQNLYDDEGNRQSTTRVFRLNGAVRSLTSNWTYDELNRVTGDANPGAGSHTYILDAAGNVTTTYTPRNNSISVTYDALNRPVQKVLSQVSYGNIGCPAWNGACLQFSFPTRDGPTVCIAGDTSTFDYDEAGNLRRAENGWALVHRTYTPNGLLAYDTLAIRTYETSAPNPCGPGDRHSGAYSAGMSDFASHVYAIHNVYDLEGRRTDLYHPDAIDFCSGSQCRTQYAYDGTTGDLSTVTVTGSPADTTTFAYDAAGRDTATTYPGGVRMRRSYDSDGNVITRNGPFTSGDAITRDASGRVVSGAIGDIAGDGPANISLVYGALGAVVYAENLTKGATFEEDSVDAVGNRLWQRAFGMNDLYPDRHRRTFIDPYTGRLDSIKVVPPQPAGWPVDSVPPDTTYLINREYIPIYDGAGNVQLTYGWPNPNFDLGYWNASLDESASYFDAEERLRIFNRHVDYGSGSGPGGVYEEYRYDALGRRVLVRSRCTWDQNQPYCKGYLERTVWDGDQVLYEIRAPGHDSASTYWLENDGYSGTYPYPSYDALLGRVGYVHAHGIDAPLAVYRMGWGGQPNVFAVAPHANYQGVFEIGSIIGGTYTGWSTRTCQGYSGCPVMNWPGGNTTIDGQTPNPNPVQTWMGNLLGQKTDGSRLQYLRNRYYDPATGRFTQSDPIGLAGGLNLYGFASGDPVNFGDPFGLKITLPGSESIRSALRQLAAGSQTFRRMFSGMYKAPVAEIDVRIEGCSDGRANCEAVNHGGGFTYNRGTALVNEIDDRVLADGALMARLAHELVEAALASGSRGQEVAGLSCQSGESAHNCAVRYQKEVMGQVEAAREAQAKKEPGGEE